MGIRTNGGDRMNGLTNEEYAEIGKAFHKLQQHWHSRSHSFVNDLGKLEYNHYNDVVEWYRKLREVNEE